MTTTSSPISDVLEAANKIFFDQIKSADQKAAYVITVALALTVTSDVAREAFKISSYVIRGCFSAIVAFSHVAFILSTLIFAILVIFPRFRGGTNALFWGAWPEASNRLLSMRDNGLFDQDKEYIESNMSLGKICYNKFRSLRVSFVLLVLSCLTHAALLAIAK